MKNYSALLIFGILLTTTAGCSSPRFSTDNLPLVHKIDIQQGNVVTQDMLSQLEYGMDKKKVRFIMGSPLITDTFHNNRWDYVYTYKEGRDDHEQRRVTLFFRDQVLIKVDGDVQAASGELTRERRQMETVDVPGEYNPSVFSRVKKKLPLIGDDDAPETIKKSAEQVAGDEQAEKIEQVQEDIPVVEATPQPVETPDTKVETSEEAPEEKGFFGRLWDKATGEEADPDLED